MTNHFEADSPATDVQDLLDLGQQLDFSSVEEHTPIFEEMISELKKSLES